MIETSIFTSPNVTAYNVLSEVNNYIYAYRSRELAEFSILTGDLEDKPNIYIMARPFEDSNGQYLLSKTENALTRIIIFPLSIDIHQMPTMSQLNELAEDFVSGLIDYLQAQFASKETRIGNDQQNNTNVVVNTDPFAGLSDIEKQVKAKYGKVTPKRVDSMKETIEAKRLQALGLSDEIIAERLGMDIDTVRRRLGKKK